MILGFAHLAINVDNLKEAESIWGMRGYTRKSLYLDVPNHPNKKNFLANYRSFHDLLLLTGKGLWPLELTYHCPTHKLNTQLTWSREAIMVKVREPEPLRHFLKNGLGFGTLDESLILNSRLSGWSCRLQVNAGSDLPVSLDSFGPTCLAFYSTNTAEDAMRLIELGATESTGSFDLILGERKMSIAMLRAPGGPLLELINPRYKHDDTNY